jgi:hypothetical protein
MSSKTKKPLPWQSGHLSPFTFPVFSQVEQPCSFLSQSFNPSRDENSATFFMVGAVGIEPTVLGLRIPCSTAELRSCKSTRIRT